VQIAMPLLCRKLRSNDERTEIGPVLDDLKQVPGFTCFKRRDTEVIQDQYFDPFDLGKKLEVFIIPKNYNKRYYI